MGTIADVLKSIQKLPARYPFAAFLICLAFVFAPEAIAKTLGIAEIRESYKAWISIAMLVLFALWLAQVTPSIQLRWQARVRQAAWNENITSLLNGLSLEERVILAECVRRNEQTITLDMTLPAAMSLCDKGFMRKAGGRGEIHAWPHTVPLKVWDLLIGDPSRILHDEAWQDIEVAFRRITRDPASGW